MTLDWLYLIILFGAIQGVFLTVALVTKRRNRTANKLLAAAMLVFSVGMASTVYHAAGLEQRFPHFFGWAYPLPFLYGPLVYLYARAAADRDYRLTRRDTFHFVPFLVVVLLGIPIYLMSGADKIAWYRSLVAGDIPLWIRIADPLKYVSGMAYIWATIAFLRRHRENVKKSYSSTERVNLRWLLWLGGSATAIWLMAIGIALAESTGWVRISRGDDFVALAIALFIYGIGYMGLRQPEVFRFETAEYPIAVAKPVQAPSVMAVASVTAAPAENSEPAYERSGLSDAEARRLKEQLLALMDAERPWKNSELTLADLAERLSTTPHKLSEVLNTGIGETFYDFVNGYRVREVQRRIAAGDGRTLKILSLALDAGFASKSTFNQVFKKHTSQTPSDFRQTVGA
ncbi:MAG TPA: helix-turn-helix transcriptional regulator [Gemmatimonadaceae bacterium]|nr:helix-turn-helix transcriptional regulator [Gemmatimonadaceae bacterium]